MIPMILASGAGHDPKDHVVAHGLFRLLPSNIHLPDFLPLCGDQAGEFWFTNHLLMTLVAATLTLLIFVPIGRRYQVALIRGGIQPAQKGLAGMIEALMDALRTAVVRPLLKDSTDRFMPLLWSLFFFILINNLLGMIPLGSIFGLAVGNQHIGGTATGNINITAGLALVAFFAIHAGGIAQVFQQLKAGTYGHHDHGEHGDEHEAEHEEHSQAAHGHGHSSHDHGHHAHGKTAGEAMLLAPVLYLCNFAPHVFAPKGRRTPGIPLRLVMIIVYALVVGLEFYGLVSIFGGSGAAGVGFGIGIVLGASYAVGSGGLHVLDIADALMWAFLLVLELVGAMVKPFALMIRLFANMAAGHIVLASLLLLLPAYHGLGAGYLAGSLPIAIGCVLLSCMELFVALLQAYIFMFLTSIFLSMAVYPEH